MAGVSENAQVTGHVPRAPGDHSCLQREGGHGRNGTATCWGGRALRSPGSGEGPRAVPGGKGTVSVCRQQGTAPSPGSQPGRGCTGCSGAPSPAPRGFTIPVTPCVARKDGTPLRSTSGNRPGVRSTPQRVQSATWGCVPAVTMAQ